MFRVSDPAVGSEAYKGYYVGLNPGAGVIELGKSSSNRWIVVASAKYPLKLKENYKLKIKAAGTNFQIFINNDDKPVISAADDEYKDGSVGLRAFNALATLDNIKLVSNK